MTSIICPQGCWLEVSNRKVQEEPPRQVFFFLGRGYFFLNSSKYRHGSKLLRYHYALLMKFSQLKNLSLKLICSTGLPHCSVSGSNRTPCIIRYNEDTNKAAGACQMHIATVAPCFLPTSRRCNCQYYSINQIGIKILLLGQQSRVYIDSASDNNLSFPALSYQFRPMLYRLPVLGPSSPYLSVYRFSPC